MTLTRCSWCLTDPLYIKYHDNEWGVPVHDDKKHFEFLVLECMQAGLSWLTVLKKRENFRKAFDGFDPGKVSEYDAMKIEQLMLNPGIIRNRLKISACISNARCFLGICNEFGTFDQYIWSFVNFQPVLNCWETLEQIPVRTPLSDKISKNLKKRGFKFTGTTIIYAHIQAIGLVNDHLTNCFRYNELAALSL